METLLKISTVFHPKIDGQTEVVNQSLENLLRYVVGEPPSTLDLVLPCAKFMYNNSINRYTSLRSYEVMHGYKPMAPIDLIPMSSFLRPSKSAKSFTCCMSKLQKSINKQINLHNSRYRSIVDTHKRFKKLDVGDYVMVRMCHEHFSHGTFKKLQATLDHLKYSLGWLKMGMPLAYLMIEE